MTSSPSLSPWATVRFRRAKDVRGWALLGIPLPLYPQVMQRLFEQQARFINKHHQGEFVSVLFEAPTALAAELALTFPSPAGHGSLSTNEAGDRILYGKFANSPRAQHQSEPTGPGLAELGQCEAFWQVVQALANEKSGNEKSGNEKSANEKSAHTKSDHKNVTSRENWADEPQLNEGHLPEAQGGLDKGPDEERADEEALVETITVDWDEEGWEDDDLPLPAAADEAEALQADDEREESFEDIWVESETEPLEISAETPEISMLETLEHRENGDDGEEVPSHSATHDSGVDNPVPPVIPTELEANHLLDKTLPTPESAETLVVEAEEPTSVRLEPFPREVMVNGLSPTNPQAVNYSITPTAVGKVLGEMTIEQALAHRTSQPDLPSVPMPWRDEPSLPDWTPAPTPSQTSQDTDPPVLRPEEAQTDWMTPGESVLQGDRFQIELLLHHGVEAWNRWRSQNPNLRPNLRGAYLNHLDLRWADFHDADLRFAFLFYSDLAEADLYGASLLGADLIHANLEAADLRWAALSGAYLSYANLSYADLRDANLREAFCYGAQFHGAFLPHDRPMEHTGP